MKKEQNQKGKKYKMAVDEQSIGFSPLARLDNSLLSSYAVSQRAIVQSSETFLSQK